MLVDKRTLISSMLSTFLHFKDCRSEDYTEKKKEKKKKKKKKENQMDKVGIMGDEFPFLGFC